MRNKWPKRFFPFIAFLLLVPWSVAYAFDVNADVSDSVQIEVAAEAVKPAYTAFGNAIGGVTTPGDLFYIDATRDSADIKVILYFTNTPQLMKYYRYLIFNVGVYAENGAGEWERATGSDGNPVRETYITARNGQVDFLLPGYNRYKVTIDSGVFYCTNASADADSLSPRFYLEVD